MILNRVCNYYQDILGVLPSKFKFSYATEDLALQLLKNINKDEASGRDNLSRKLLKDGTNILAKPILELCNLSIKFSLFPTDCQISQSKPLFKKGFTIFCKSYRQFSLLSLISKIIEKAIHNQTQEFLDSNKKLERFQSRFRKHFSTDLCVSYLNNQIATCFESSIHPGMMLIDLQKAFDTINHEILVNKMECLGGL